MRFLLCIFIIVGSLAKSQLTDPRTNAAFSPFENLLKQSDRPLVNQQGISCTGNTFFAIEGDGSIRELFLGATSASLLSTAYPKGHMSLALCNNLNSGTFSPTFYSDVINGGAFFDGNNWQSAFTTNYINYGGYGNHLYLQELWATGYKIVHFNGSQVNTIYHSTTKQQGTADLAVDPAGNVYFLTCGTSPYSDSLFVMSSTGVILKQMPFVIDFTHAYGSFFHNGQLYIGIGSSSTVAPNSLLSINVNGNTPVITGTISMPQSLIFSDLANCPYSVDVTNLAEVERKNTLDIHPQPSQEFLNVEFADSEHREISIFDLHGKLISAVRSSGTKVRLSVEDLKSGVYILMVADLRNGALIRKKIVVE